MGKHLRKIFIKCREKDKLTMTTEKSNTNNDDSKKIASVLNGCVYAACNTVRESAKVIACKTQERYYTEKDKIKIHDALVDAEALMKSENANVTFNINGDKTITMKIVVNDSKSNDVTTVTFDEEDIKLGLLTYFNYNSK